MNRFFFFFFFFFFLPKLIENFLLMFYKIYFSIPSFSAELLKAAESSAMTYIRAWLRPCSPFIFDL